MSASHFVKHLGRSHFLRRALINGLSAVLSKSEIPQLRRQLRPLNRSRNDLVASAFSSSSLPSSFTAVDPLSADSFGSPYLSAQIQCPRNALVDEFCESLLCFGASSTSVAGNDDDDDEGSNEVCVTCTFLESQDVDECISLAARSIGLNELPSYFVEKGEQYEWIKKTQESFHPLQIVEGVWIVPEWQIPPENNAVNIILNPGLAFGTGEHPTTKLCLLQLHKVIKAGDCALDYGTGSGVLAIASLKFGAASCVGVDIDPLAISSACHNAALNNIEPEKMQLLLMPSDDYDTKGRSTDEAIERNSYCKDAILETNKYDVVIANILLNPLLELTESIVSYTRPGATIVLSGVLIEQVPRIIDRYSSFMVNMTTTQMEDYACITGTKKEDVHG